MTERYLGKIRAAKIGTGGYDDAMFGVTFDLGGEDWGVGDFWGAWNFPPGEGAAWTIEDQDRKIAQVFNRLRALMKDALVEDFNNLEGVPVEAEFVDGSLKSWRILKEVL